MGSVDTFVDAYETRSIEAFMRLVFPPEWAPIAARILESGATMSEDVVPWAPRWTPVSPTVRFGHPGIATMVKSCIYRAHDCLHNLWGLPHPGESYSDADFAVYKRAQMCGEVAVLTLTEFALCRSLHERFPELRAMLWERNALPMWLDGGPLAGRTVQQIAARLDGVLHKGVRPRWVREDAHATAFADDYVPMLARDRQLVDHNWALMRSAGWQPANLPNARYNPNLDGLELTTWMIDDFYHLLDTDPMVDRALRGFNKNRRDGIELPLGWNEED
jgi:hypothetical protein